MDTRSSGDYTAQLCALCDRLITYRDVLREGVQCLDFHQRAHRRCYWARYADRRPPVVEERQAAMEMMEQ